MGKMPSSFVNDNCLYLKKKMFLIYEQTVPLTKAAWCHWCLVNNFKKRSLYCTQITFLSPGWMAEFLNIFNSVKTYKWRSGPVETTARNRCEKLRVWWHFTEHIYYTVMYSEIFSLCLAHPLQIQIVISAFGWGHWLDVNPGIHVYNYEYEERFMTDTNKPPHGLLLMFWCICVQCYCKMINDFIFGGLDHEKEILSVWLRSLKSEGVGSL